MRVVACLLVFAALAGCADGDPEPTDAPGGPEGPATDGTDAVGETAPDAPAGEMPVPQHVEFASCSLEQGFLAVPMTAAAALLPADFAPAFFFEGYADYPVPDELTLLAEVDLGWIHCAGDDAGIGDNSQFLAAIVIEPPVAELQAGHVTTYAYLLASATPSSNVSALYSAWGIAVEPADLSYAVDNVEGIGTTTVGFDSPSATGELTMLLAPAEGAARPGESFRFFYHVDDTLHSLDVLVDDHTTYLGPAVAQVAGSAPWLSAFTGGSTLGIAGQVRDDPWGVSWTHTVFE